MQTQRQLWQVLPQLLRCCTSASEATALRCVEQYATQSAQHAAPGSGWLQLAALRSLSSHSATTGFQSGPVRHYSKPVLYQLPPNIAEIVDAIESKPKGRPAPPLEPRVMTAESQRTGVIAIKAGMTQEWDEWGARVPLTVLWIDDCEVVRVKQAELDGVTSLQLGAGSKKEKQLHTREIGVFKAAGVPLKRRTREFRVSKDALLPVGTQITAAHFVAGQFVDVTGVTKGKGFQGVMKRWGFAGQPASHGVSKTHRAPGSIGNRSDPGRVFPGKKLPGRMGADRVTQQHCWLYKVDPARNLLYVRGQVPGPVGSWCYVRDAFRWKWEAKRQVPLPFPTHLDPQPPPVTVAKADADPYRVYAADVDYFEERWKGD